MPVRKITSLPQGTFIGKVAVENGSPIQQPFFCGSIQIDMEEYARNKQHELDVPDISEFDLDALHKCLKTPGVRHEYLKKWMRIRLKNEWNLKDYSSDEFEAELDSRMNSLSDEQFDALIEEATPDLERMEIDAVIERNYYNIIGDIKYLIDLEYDSVSTCDNDYDVQEIMRQDEEPETSQKRTETPEDKFRKVLNKDIAVVQLGARARQQLVSCGISRLGQLAVLSREQLLQMPQIGEAIASDIETMLESYGLTLGMDLSKYGYETADR